MPGVTGITGVNVLPFGCDAYMNRVLHHSPIAYWPLYEASGTVVECLVNPAQNGVYSSDVASWPPEEGIGDGNTAPFFDSIANRVTLTTAPLLAAFNGDTGALSLWYRVANIGVWTDGTVRQMAYFRDVAYNNLVNIRRTNVNNQAIGWYYAGGVVENITLVGRSSTDYVHMMLVWDNVADVVTLYEDGEVVGSSIGLGAFGVIQAAYIGSDAGANLWHGRLAHVALFDYIPSQCIISDLASV